MKKIWLEKSFLWYNDGEFNLPGITHFFDYPKTFNVYKTTLFVQLHTRSTYTDS